MEHTFTVIGAIVVIVGAVIAIGIYRRKNHVNKQGGGARPGDKIK